MPKRVLITGSPPRADSVAELFRRAGVEATTLAPGSLDTLGSTPRWDYYVQLPVLVPADGDTVVQRLHSFLVAGLLSRFTALERVLPILNPGATVVLVSGNLPADLSAPDDRLARLALLRVLAHAARADMTPGKAHIHIVNADRSDHQVVASAVGDYQDPGTELSRLPDTPDWDRDYSDWRSQVMGMAAIET
jgi:hypothetical protein